METTNENNKVLWELISKYIAPYTSPESCKKVYNAYTEEWRKYHNASHVVYMYTSFMRLIHRIDIDCTMWREGIILMILYHDVWCKVGHEHGLNEKKSAAWAIKDCAPRLEARYRQSLWQGIRATADHTLDNVNPEFHREVGVLLDLDLMNLALPLPHFQLLTEKIWQEYEPVMTHEEFDEGRGQWAQTFLDRPFIYHTDLFRKRIEQKACDNLKTLLKK